MKFGIKFKILLGVSILLMISTAFNLGYSYKLFVEDKTSYIFETGLKKAENISDQINFKLNDLNVRTGFNALLLDNPSIDFEKLINGQSEMVLTGIIDTNGGSLATTKQFLNTKSMNNLTSTHGVTVEELVAEVQSKLKDRSKLGRSQTWLFSPKANLKLLINFAQIPGGETFIFSVSDFSPLLEIFYRDQTYTNKVISLSSAKDRQENADWISRLDYKKSKKGAFETTLNNQAVLLAYAFVNDKILVLSAINKEDAFGVTKYLILKTALFALFLVGIATIAGIYFSSSITFPIVQLTSVAKKIASGNFTSNVRINSSDEIKILGDTFNFMSYEIRGLLKNKEELIAKLEDYSKNLELMVEQRTIELKEANDFMALMVNSLTQGLLVFDGELKCHPMFTKACEPIFGVSPLNKSIIDVLSITDESATQELKQWADVMFSELIPFESAVGLGPKQKITGKTYSDDNYKYVQLDYYPMRNEDEKISNVVMIATDKTSEVQATEKAKERDSYVSMILKILNNKTQFESFSNEVESICEQFNRAYSVEEKRIEFDLCMMLFHTLNGGFGIYSITKLQMMAREYETEISNIKETSPDPVEYILRIEMHVENLKKEFHRFKVELDALIGTRFATSESVTEIPRDKILELKALVLETNNQELQEYYLEHFVKVPIINYFKAYDDLCRTTAVKINKAFNGLTFHNPELRVEAEPLLEFFNVLVHLFRNCLDHGLEDTYKRESVGKTPDGHIDVGFAVVNTNKGKMLSTIIRDDGAGIDPSIIRSRCQKLKPEEDVSHLSDKEVIYKIFEPFFSTRDEVSALSGRGVGMSAIKEVVDRLNGEIEVKSQVGRGTIFSFLIPIK